MYDPVFCKKTKRNRKKKRKLQFIILLYGIIFAEGRFARLQQRDRFFEF
jgi:hypothetical protein